MLESPNIGSLTHLNIQVGKKEVHIYINLYLHFEQTHILKNVTRKAPLNQLLNLGPPSIQVSSQVESLFIDNNHFVGREFLFLKDSHFVGQSLHRYKVSLLIAIFSQIQSSLHRQKCLEILSSFIDKVSSILTRRSVLHIPSLPNDTSGRFFL